MYDPQQEDIWETAIRTAESVQLPYEAGVSRRERNRERGFEQAKAQIITALRQAQKESIARRYPLVK